MKLAVVLSVILAFVLVDNVKCDFGGFFPVLFGELYNEHVHVPAQGSDVVIYYIKYPLNVSNKKKSNKKFN